ncbi:MAG TPA: hypothetical protein VLT35_02725 [Methanocella sp.]|nr:hypothetical protein [Methanocella sp.]
MAEKASFLEKYFANDDGKFDPNDHIDKFALVYLAVVFLSCVMLRVLGII